jgi:hypothetical protein
VTRSVDPVVIAERQRTSTEAGGAPARVGELLARAYAGAWRADPPPLSMPLGDVASILPNLIDFGGVGLAWPRLEARAGEYGAAGMALEYGYRQQMDANRDAPASVASAVRLLIDAGVEPVLFKGWAISRLYPSEAVRLSGDIDVVVRSRDFDRAKAAIGEAYATGLSAHVDLHREDDWLDLPGRDFRCHLETIPVNEVDVLVPSHEDHLRIVCHHFIRHAAFRPLWLCDIALMLESRPPNFDWDRFLRRDGLRTDWMVTALLLAHEVLGARIDDTPAAGRARHLPAWLVPALLTRWEHNERSVESIMAEVGDRGILSEFSRHRWPDPIGATVYLNAPFNRFPRLPLQWAAFLHRAATYGVPGIIQGSVGRRWFGPATRVIGRS